MPPPLDTRLARLGAVMQFAFVPRDFDAAVAFWTGTMGVGPFFLLENMRLPDCRYRGAPADILFSIAIAYWGDVQVELVRQENDAPSIFRGAEGGAAELHHVCILVDDLAVARAAASAMGLAVLQEGRVDPDGGVIYVDGGGGPGSIVEILQPAGGTRGLFDMMRAAARDWDGTEPLRRLG